MPTVTIQCGQAGNQLGQELWGLLATQPTCSRTPSQTTRGTWESSSSASSQLSSSSASGSSSEFFRLDAQGRRHARCLLVDTEPKVVNSLMASCGSSGIFSRSNCFTGQSGRGNNWAFGYSQTIPSRGSSNPAAVPRWNSSTMVEDPSTQEFHLLDQVEEGIRRECEAIDSAPDFLMLHSLGGGSGSGLGSRILEHIREEYPLNYIATLSVVPRSAGDSPMQSLNSTMALSFLQAYADVVMTFDNQVMLEAALKNQKAATMADVNYHIAASALGALWPLSPSEPCSGNGRIRDMATTVAADSCLKLVEARTSMVSAATSVRGIWRDACQAVARLFPHFDVLDANNPVVTSSAVLLARGFPPETIHPPQPTKPFLPPQTKLGPTAASPFLGSGSSSSNSSSRVSQKIGGPAGSGVQGGLDAYEGTALSEDAQSAAVAAYLQACHGPASFACPADAVNSVYPRHGPCKLSMCQGSPQADASKRRAMLCNTKRTDDVGGSMAVTAIANRSSAIGMMSNIAGRARAMSQTGAYLHWYERYGCSRAALNEALAVVDDMTDAYRLSHGIRDFL